MSDVEELMLADFLQTMIAHCPQLPDSVHAQDVGKNSGFLCVDSIQVDDAAILDTEHKIDGDDLQDYYVSATDPIDAAAVENIVALYRKGGKMNVRSVNHIVSTLCKKLKRMPNTTRITVGSAEKLTVVGDLHGQMDDLLRTLDDAGWPSETNKYMFNGGFADRGEHGLEVSLVIFAMLLAYPDFVFANRGSHEDEAMGYACGFQVEVSKKYDQGLFVIFCEAFRYLPLFAVINEAIFVVHGGLFHDRDVTLDSLDTINRMDYRPEAEDPNSARNKAFPQGYYLKRLQQDALWSDPHKHGEGVANNRNFDKSVAHPSGLGIMFGPSHVNKFLKTNRLKMVLRSHEMVPLGFELPFKDTPHENKIGTVCSTSNFLNSGNQAAFVVIHSHRLEGSTKVDDCNLWYSVVSFNTMKGEELESKKSERLLHELILKKWNALLLAFQTADVENTGIISKVRWAEIMRDVTKIKILWTPMSGVLVPPAGLHNLGHEVEYKVFLDRFKAGAEDELDVQGMYLQQKKLTAIFRYFDADGNGTISKQEFRAGFDVLNESLPEHMRLSDPDSIMKLMDIDGNDGVDMNEFFEIFRLLDANDGKADGDIGIKRDSVQRS
jgi:serine/threonine-protein phosphatase with EF-hand domain